MADLFLSPADVAHRKIKDAILSLRYRPGEKIAETRLAADLGLGRSPIRTALARLVSEGWIRVSPQSGTFVRTLSAGDVRELAELRVLLEVHATRMAACRVSAAELAGLRAAFDDLMAQGVDGHFDQFLALDDRFHATIHRAAGNQRIAEILRTLKDQIHWIRVTTAVVPGRVHRSLAEMDNVLRALERQDGEAAALAMREHIGNIAASFEAVPAPEADLQPVREATAR